jgi:ketosteroid isomerase-like protein
MDDRQLIERYFGAMRRGAEAEKDLVGLFAEDAIYIEPFVSSEPAVGIDEIRQRLRRGWEQPLPDLELDVLSIEVSGHEATARWVCRSPVLPGPVEGVDHYLIEHGRITRLEVRLDD